MSWPCESPLRSAAPPSGTLGSGEECEDGCTVAGNRCSPTCTLESDNTGVEPNNAAAIAQTVTATDHMIRRSAQR